MDIERKVRREYRIQEDGGLNNTVYTTVRRRAESETAGFVSFHLSFRTGIFVQFNSGGLYVLAVPAVAGVAADPPDIPGGPLEEELSGTAEGAIRNCTRDEIRGAGGKWSPPPFRKSAVQFKIILTIFSIINDISKNPNDT